MTGSGYGDEPVPGLYVPPEAELERLRHRLDVDGEVFEVRRGQSGGTEHGWIGGRNEGYGFSSSAPFDLPEAHHRESIRTFLGMIDPTTGFFADE